MRNISNHNAAITIHSCRTYSSDLIEHPLNIIIHQTNYSLQDCHIATYQGKPSETSKTSLIQLLTSLGFFEIEHMNIPNTSWNSVTTYL